MPRLIGQWTRPVYGPPPGTPTSQVSGLSRVGQRSPLSIVLIAVIVIGLVTAGLLASELYARHRAESVAGRRHRMRGAG